MARKGRPALQVQLTAEQRTELGRRVRAATTPQRDVLRARIILECAQGADAKTVARRVGTHSRTVERWRSRFVRKGLVGLNDLPRPGRPPRFSAIDRYEIIAAACNPPVPNPPAVSLAQPSSNDMGRAQTAQIPQTLEMEIGAIKADLPTSSTEPEMTQGKLSTLGQGKTGKAPRLRRTLEQVRQDVLERGTVQSISWSSIQRILSELELRPHRVKGWMHSPDPDFRTKVTAITKLYLHPAPGAVVLSIDEKTGMQALERRFSDHPDVGDHSVRREFEYKRHGTLALLCALEVHTGRVVAECGPTRTAEDLVRFMDHLASLYPQREVHVIWDNLNIHLDGPSSRWTQFNERHEHRFVFHYTPLHASWVNQVELFFSILQRQCLRDGSFGSTQELEREVIEFIADWNENKAHPFRWTFTGYPLQLGISAKEKGQRPSGVQGEEANGACVTG